MGVRTGGTTLRVEPPALRCNPFGVQTTTSRRILAAPGLGCLRIGRLRLEPRVVIVRGWAVGGRFRRRVGREYRLVCHRDRGEVNWQEEDLPDAAHAPGEAE